MSGNQKKLVCTSRLWADLMAYRYRCRCRCRGAMAYKRGVGIWGIWGCQWQGVTDLILPSSVSHTNLLFSISSFPSFPCARNMWDLHNSLSALLKYAQNINVKDFYPQSESKVPLVKPVPGLESGWMEGRYKEDGFLQPSKLVMWTFIHRWSFWFLTMYYVDNALILWNPHGIILVTFPQAACPSWHWYHQWAIRFRGSWWCYRFFILGT